MAYYEKIGAVWKAGVRWERVSGVWKSGTLWNNVLGTWKAISEIFSPPAGTYDDTQDGFASYTLTAAVAVTWTYTQTVGTGVYSSASLASGASGTSITFQCNSTGVSGQITQSASWNVTGSGAGQTANFTINLTANGLI